MHVIMYFFSFITSLEETVVHRLGVRSLHARVKAFTQTDRFCLSLFVIGTNNTRFMSLTVCLADIIQPFIHQWLGAPANVTK